MSVQVCQKTVMTLLCVVEILDMDFQAADKALRQRMLYYTLYRKGKGCRPFNLHWVIT